MLIVVCYGARLYESMTATRERVAVLAVLCIIGGFAVATTGGVAAAAGSTSVELSGGLSIPGDQVRVGEKVSVRVLVTDASDGVGSYDVTVSSGDTAVAEIVAVRPLGDPSRNVTDVTPGSATVSGIGVETRDGSDVAIVEVTLRAVGSGTANLSLSVDALGDETGRSYTVSGTSGVSFDVEGCQPVVGSLPPKDPDDDGEYEDVNGDGEVNVIDVTVLLERFDGLIPANQPCFDFNGDGVLNILDVAELLNEV